jgi:hypothetical protein
MWCAAVPEHMRKKDATGVLWRKGLLAELAKHELSLDG